VGNIGSTFTFTATEQLTTGAETPALRVTLDQLLDPAPKSLGTEPGDVALRLTVSNIGSVTVPCNGGDPHEITLEWAVNADTSINGGTIAEGLPTSPGFCDTAADSVGYNGLAPGATSTGDVDFWLPNGYLVTSAQGRLVFAGDDEKPFAEWMIP
jgi:hypothetical protein